MSQEQQKLIEEFKQSLDYRDICYMIDHAPTQDILSSCLEELGYSVGLNILTSKDNGEIKNVIIGKDGEFRVQSSWLTQGDIIVECIIVNKKK